MKDIYRKNPFYLKVIIALLILILVFNVIFAYYFFKPDGILEILQIIYFSSNIFS